MKTPSLEELYEENYEFLYLLCCKTVRYRASCHELIEDCIQETFEVAIRHWEQLTQHPNPRGWLVRTCLNLLKDRQKQDRLHQRILRRWAETGPGDLQPDAYERYFREEAARTDLEKIMAALSEEERRLYAAYFVERQTMASIAEQHHITVNQVKNVLKRIRRKAKKALRVK